ncbi:UNVERIFIED_CONTAM: hypothetical protein Cloal_3512 [Acetivibrio alkalicellulosi]
MAVLAGHDIRVVPYDIYPDELKIEKKINEHGSVYFTALVPKGERDKYIQMTQSQTPIEINHCDGTCLFKGIATNIEVKSVRDVYYVKVEGVSHTFNMDIKLKRKSFQDKDMKYTQLIDEVMKDYSGDYIDVVAKGKNIDKFIIQYDETDWEFLKRMSSHFNAPLVPDTYSDKPKFWFGTPEGGSKGDLEEYHYSVSKKIAQYRVSSQNYNKGIDEKDFIQYKIETDKILNLGDTVSFQSKSLYIYKAVSILKNGLLVHEYTMSPENRLSQDLSLNEKVVGASIEGEVIDIKEDNIRIHLEVDKDQSKDKAFWFPYSTFYTTEGETGWYCMPELKDKVKLYFPTNKEEEAIVINSIRRRTMGGDFITDPDVKIFRTKYGKEIMFNKDEIMITGKDDEILIRLIENEGIEIYSKKDIAIKADKGIKIESGKKIEMTAGSKISVKCKDSLIEMNGITTIKGKQVKTN